MKTLYVMKIQLIYIEPTYITGKIMILNIEYKTKKNKK